MSESILEQPNGRRRNPVEKEEIQSKIAERRIHGESFSAIALFVGLSERQVRRQYHKFIAFRSKELLKNKKHLLSEILLQYDHSLNHASRQLLKAEEEEGSLVTRHLSLAVEG